MTTYSDRTFGSGERIQLDSNEFFNCNFRGCIIEFGGTGPVVMDTCKFDNVRWSFVGPAAATLTFLSAMANDLGHSGRQIVEHTFAQILNPAPASAIDMETRGAMSQA